MIVNFLLDTNILSEPTKIQPDPKVVKQLSGNLHLSATASVIYHELKFGYLRMPESAKKEAIQSYIENELTNSLPILPYCEAAASWHAEERVRLQKAGKIPPYIDGQIAAIAAVNNLVLVTRNTNDFRNFEGLKIESWFA